MIISMKAAVINCEMTNRDYRVVQERCKKLGVKPIDIVSEHMKMLKEINPKRCIPVSTVVSIEQDAEHE